MGRLIKGRARDFDLVRVERTQHGFSGLEKSSDNNSENEDE